MDALGRHVRHAVRLLFRAPLFTLTATLSLAIGIGANTAIFTAASAILLAPTPGVRDMSTLVDIGRTTGGQGFDTTSFPTYADLAARGSVFEGVYAIRFEPRPMSLGGDDGAERVYNHEVSASYFDVIGVEPAVGTFFRTDEEVVGVPLRKVVLSHALWQRRFGGRPDVVGEEIVLNGDRFTVVGVTPRGFRGTTVVVPDLWVPATSLARGMASEQTLRGRQNSWLVLGARLKPGVSLVQAQAALDAFMADLRRDYPDVYRDRGLAVLPASRLPGMAGQYVTPFFGLLLGVTGLVLLVTCTNLAGLLLARSAARAREVAVRLALGASRASLVRMLMTETLLVFVAGSIAAVVLAGWMARALASFVSTLPFPVSLDLVVDWRVLAFTAGLALAAACLTGLVPALQGSRRELVPDLKADASAPRRQRMRHVFIVLQLAFCLVLIVMAGLLLRALSAASTVPPGFDVDPIEVATVDLTLGGYTDDESPEAAERLRGALTAVAGVESVAFARMVPLDGGGLGLGGLRRAGTTGPESRIDTDWNVISPDYFATLGMPLVRGRAFTPADRAGAPGVAIVNERLAADVWPGEDPIGKLLEYGDFRPGQESSIATLAVVGVAGNAKYRWLGEVDAPFIYVPYAQQPMREVNYFLRRRAGAESVALQPAVRQILREFDANLPLVRMQSLRSYADLGVLPQRLAASLAGSLGLVALLLAGIGVYGVTAFAVASRTREIGIRVALGADRARVMRLVFFQGVRLAAIGGAIGLALALVAAQLVSSLLFGVSPIDPVTYLATTGTLALVTIAATFVPARRAATVDPVTALRAE